MAFGAEEKHVYGRKVRHSRKSRQFRVEGNRRHMAIWSPGLAARLIFEKLLRIGTPAIIVRTERVLQDASPVSRLLHLARHLIELFWD
jgi:hypothetical protein